MSLPSAHTFHPFSLLPKELRLQIWEDAIPQERMIRVSLKPHTDRRYDLAAAEPRYLQKNHLKRPISGERYRALVCGRQLNSKFLRVSGEARGAALGFYRVHIPVYMTGPSHTRRSTLYFNPEHDFLHIWADAPVKETLIDFLWDLRAYDPRDVGLLRLGVDLEGFCANDLQYVKKSDLVLVRQRTVLAETLSRLRDVWFINLQAAAASGTKPRSMGGHITSRGHFMNSGPVLRDVPVFQRAGVDLRSGVEKELEQVYMGEVDPREILFRWRRLLRYWGVDYESAQVDYRLFVGNVPLTFHKRQSTSLAETGKAMGHLTLHEEQDEAAEHHIKGLGSQCEIKHVDSNTEQPAATGSWLFPLQAVGELGEGDRLADMNFLGRRVLDMSSYRPELVLSKPT